ncbi:MAG TPA: PIN domain-containing protein [Pilimelia sp.]|nr:PIN domain-containing protein [Pilimelia sp.]
MTVRFLLDTSAIARIQQGVAASRWARAASAGTVALCDPVELEVLRKTDGGGPRRAMRRLLRETYPWCPVPDNAWDRALDLQDRLSDASQHRGVSIVDLVIAVTAARHRLTVLHDDRDYEVISRVTGLPVQRVID